MFHVFFFFFWFLRNEKQTRESEKKKKKKREKEGVSLSLSLSVQSRMSALFDFNAFLTVVLLTVCTCAYVKMRAPGILSERTG